MARWSNTHCEIASGITTNTLNSKTGGSTWEKEKKKNCPITQ